MDEGIHTHTTLIILDPESHLMKLNIGKFKTDKRTILQNLPSTGIAMAMNLDSFKMELGKFMKGKTIKATSHDGYVLASNVRGNMPLIISSWELQVGSLLSVGFLISIRFTTVRTECWTLA